MKFDQYELKARVLPAILSTVLPLFLFNYFLVHQGLQQLFAALAEWQVVSGVTSTFIFLYFIIELNRSVSKFIFEKYLFEDDQKLPTTQLLMFSDSNYSEDFKRRIRTKIMTEFQIRVLNEDEEKENPELARKLIVEAVSRIRNSMREDTFIKQSNIRYGYFRNLIGGSVIGSIIAIANVAYLHYNNLAEWAIYVNYALICLYLFLLACSRWLLKAHGYNYAKSLLENYDHKEP